VLWGYAEIAERLAGGGTQADERYGRWIAMYTSGEFAELAGWARVLTSSRYELAVWQMAWAGEHWLP